MSLAKIISSVLAMFLLIVLVSPIAYAASSTYGGIYDATCNDTTGSKASQSSVCKTDNKDNITGPDGIILKASKIIAYITAFAAIIMIMVGGLRYITSSGDSNALKSARDTIIYSVIGLVVIVVAQALVTAVVSRL